MQLFHAARSHPLTGSPRRSDDYTLTVAQQPLIGRAAGKEKSIYSPSSLKVRLIKAPGNTRWPIDPPPIVSFTFNNGDKTKLVKAPAYHDELT